MAPVIAIACLPVALFGLGVEAGVEDSEVLGAVEAADDLLARFRTGSSLDMSIVYMGDRDLFRSIGIVACLSKPR